MSEPIHIYDGHKDEWREATQRDLDLNLRLVRMLGEYRVAIKKADTEYEAKLAELKEKYS
jgi:hypothetical protein